MFNDNPWYGKVEVDFREVFFVGSWDNTKSRENPANSLLRFSYLKIVKWNLEISAIYLAFINNFSIQAIELTINGTYLLAINMSIGS